MGCHRRDYSGVKCCALVVAVLVLLCYSGEVEGRSGLALQSYREPPAPPIFPSSFEVAYNFSLPYEKTVQKDGLVYPVTFWRDAERGVSRMDTFGGRNILISTKDREIEIMPRLQKLICRVNEPDEDDVSLVSAPVLPDVSSWDYNGTVELRGQQAHLWVYEKSHGAKVTLYKFYVAEDGAPLRLHMDGNDMFSGAHFDEYIADYEYLKAGPVDEDVFRPPAICHGHEPQKLARPPAFPLRMAALLPTVRIEGRDELYDEFAAAHGRRHATAAEYEHRRTVFHSNRLLVEAHNAANSHNFTLALNRFADWSQEEFEAVMLPRHGQEKGLVARRRGADSGELPYERLAPSWRLPTAVDWRGTGADGLVKDQATCGSCWAFGATAALQSAYWAATGKKASFSEQQLMDCSWKFGLNHACDGGDYDSAMDYLVNVGGIAKENGYEYLGQDNFCDNHFMADTKNPSSSLVRVKGYAYVPPHDDEALMEAVYSRGTIAVSLDASQPSFRFYASGTFDEPKCMWKSDDLDHAVALVGYGTDEAGTDYWIIKNSWSSHWGDNGYVKIARGHHGCGITTDPVYAVFDGKHRYELSDEEPVESA